MAGEEFKTANPGKRMQRQVDSLEIIREKALQWWENLPTAIDRLKNIKQTNYDLALDHAEKGNVLDAWWRLKLAVWLEPEHADAWYNLGCCEYMRGRKEAAARSLRKALDLRPGFPEAIFMLGVVDGSTSPTSMPPDMLRSYFDSLAEYFDETQLDGLGYAGHTQLYHLLLRIAGPDNMTGFDILDAGCGTGLCGTQFFRRAAKLIGVDISQKMLDQARKKTDEGRAVYHGLIHQDIAHYAETVNDAHYDVVVAGNLFPCAGDISGLLPAMASLLKPGGVLLFNAEIGEKQDIAMREGEGRFAHRLTYLQNQLEMCGFADIHITTAPLFAGHKGWLGAARKPGPARFIVTEETVRPTVVTSAGESQQGEYPETEKTD